MISGRLTLVIREKTASILTTFPFTLNLLSGRETYRQGLQNAWGSRVFGRFRAYTPLKNGVQESFGRNSLLPSTVLPRQLAVSWSYALFKESPEC